MALHHLDLRAFFFGAQKKQNQPPARKSRSLPPCQGGRKRKAAHSFSAGIETNRTLSLGRARTCSEGSCARLSLRWRRVSAIAATIATSRITAAISKA